MEVTEARAWLEALSGVGPKTSAAVLSFSTLRRPALPVDSHHHRVAVRTGMIPATLAVGPAHAVLSAQLPHDWDAQQIYDNHEVMMLHGQRCCYFRNPACGRCPLLDLCPTGQRRMAPGKLPVTVRVDPESDQALPLPPRSAWTATPWPAHSLRRYRRAAGGPR